MGQGRKEGRSGRFTQRGTGHCSTCRVRTRHRCMPQLFIQLPSLVAMLGEWPVLKLTLRALPWFTLLVRPGGLDLSMDPLLDDEEFEDTFLSRLGLYW